MFAVSESDIADPWNKNSRTVSTWKIFKQVHDEYLLHNEVDVKANIGKPLSNKEFFSYLMLSW